MGARGIQNHAPGVCVRLVTPGHSFCPWPAILVSVARNRQNRPATARSAGRPWIRSRTDQSGLKEKWEGEWAKPPGMDVVSGGYSGLMFTATLTGKPPVVRVSTGGFAYRGGQGNPWRSTRSPRVQGWASCSHKPLEDTTSSQGFPWPWRSVNPLGRFHPGGFSGPRQEVWGRPSPRQFRPGSLVGIGHRQAIRPRGQRFDSRPENQRPWGGRHPTAGDGPPGDRPEFGVRRRRVKSRVACPPS